MCCARHVFHMPAMYVTLVGHVCLLYFQVDNGSGPDDISQ